MAIIDIKRCTLKIKDGGANELTVTIGQGNFQYEEKRNFDYIKDRGALNDVRAGDEEPVDVSLDFSWEELKSITSDTTPTIEEALKKIGAASAWASSDSDPCNPYAVDLEFEHDPACSGTGTAQQKETITLADFRYESLNHDVRNSQVSVRGRCNVTMATIARSANT